MKRRGLITSVILAVAVFVGLALYGDVPELVDQVSSFPVSLWFAVLGLALLNYLIRFVRWHYYLRLLGIRISPVASGAIFASGLSMVVSPGRVGELAKSYYLKEKLGVPAAQSSPAVITERVTDLASVLLLSLWGLALVPYGWAFAGVALGLLAAFAVLVLSSWGSNQVLRLPMPSRWRPFLATSIDAFRQIMSMKALTVAVFLGVLAWLAEGAGLWVVLHGLDAPGSFGQAISIYAVATLLGAATMLPGGLVGTEAGMVALLRQVDLNETQASSATFIIRLCTLWFAVVIGLAALVCVQLYMPNRPDRQPSTLTPADTPTAAGP